MGGAIAEKRAIALARPWTPRPGSCHDFDGPQPDLRRARHPSLRTFDDVKLRGLSYFAASAAAFASVRAVQARRETASEIVWEELVHVVDPPPAQGVPAPEPSAEIEDRKEFERTNGDQEDAVEPELSPHQEGVSALALIRRTLIVVLGLALIAMLGVWVLTPNRSPASGATPPAKSSTRIEIGLLTDQGSRSAKPELASSWEAALRSAGLPFRWVHASDLNRSATSALVGSHPVIIIPDGLGANLPPAISARVGQYVRAGGQLVVVTNGQNFAHVTGIRAQDADKRAQQARLTFASAASARWWGVPLGSLSTTHALTGSDHRELRYPVARARRTGAHVTVVAASGATPIIALNHLGRGTGIFVNLPLGRLRMHHDDAPIRTMLVAVTSRVAQVPRLIPSPRGVGGLAFDVRPASAAERRAILIAGRSPLQSENWLKGTARYAVAMRSIERVSGRAVDLDVSTKGTQLAEVRAALTRVRRDTNRLAARGDLTLRPTAAYESFTRRFAKTTMSATRDGQVLRVRIDNPQGLKEIAVSIPRSLARGPVPAGFRRRVGVDGQDVYIATTNASDLQFRLKLRTPLAG